MALPGCAGVLRICVFLGVIPSTATSQQGLALLAGGAPPASELSLLHSLVDLVFALPADAFFASHAQYSSAQSYLVHNDPEFHKHIRLLQCVTNSAVAAAGALDGGGSAPAHHADSVLSDQMDLFPATLMMTANALRQVKEKQGQGKKNMCVSHSIAHPKSAPAAVLCTQELIGRVHTARFVANVC